MKITDLQIGRISVPLNKPFKTALRTVNSVEDVIVKITTDTGHVGYGEAPPTAVITGDTTGSITAAINDVINNFSKGTFGVVQRAKGVYLPGYGISFACLINIHLAMVNTPFGVVARNEVTPEIKKQRIEELKNEMIRLLLDNGRGFQQLGREESVSITIFIEDRNIPDEPRANKSIVLSVPKKDLDELGQRNDRLKEFKQRVNVVEY